MVDKDKNNSNSKANTENNDFESATELNLHSQKHFKNKNSKTQINREKVEFLKQKFNLIRKIKPLKIRKSKYKNDSTFDPKDLDPQRFAEMSPIWEKARRDRTSEEKFYYKKEARIYHKYFFLYLSREIRRTRWTPRKQLSTKFIITVLFIIFFAGLFAILETIIIPLFRIFKLT